VRKPKNLDRYVPVAQAAAALRKLADDLERRGREGDLVDWSLDLRCWNHTWEQEKAAKK
jgi:hypothetical protein